jgi:hypothetical protein
MTPLSCFLLLRFPPSTALQQSVRKATMNLLLFLLCLAFLPLSLARLPSHLDPTGAQFCDTLQSQLVQQLGAVGGIAIPGLLPLPGNPAALGNNNGKGNCSSSSEIRGNVYGVQGILGNVVGSVSGAGSNAAGSGGGRKLHQLGSSGPLTVRGLSCRNVYFKRQSFVVCCCGRLSKSRGRCMGGDTIAM